MIWKMWVIPLVTIHFLKCWVTSALVITFKQDAINFAWEFLTSKDYMGIPKRSCMSLSMRLMMKRLTCGPKKWVCPEAHMIRIGDNKGATIRL